MACPGVFFALHSEQRERLLTLDSGEKRLDYVKNEIEAAWDEEHLLEPENQTRSQT